MGKNAAVAKAHHGRVRRSWGRIGEELPERAPTDNRTGVAVVAILFGLVLSKLAEGVARTLQKLFAAGPGNLVACQTQPGVTSQPGTWLWHYAVAVTLVMTSFVGYFGSKNGPQLKIKFFNLPLAQIALDCTMVGSYFLLTVYVEGCDRDPSATPEAFLVAWSFLLYVVWDFFGKRIARDPYSQIALGQLPHDGGAARRRVTQLFFVATALIFIATKTGHDSWLSLGRFADDDRQVAAVDAFLIVLLLLYRVAKSVWDPGIAYREQPPAAEASAEEAATVPYGDWTRMVPPVVADNIEALAALGWSAPAPLAMNPQVSAALAHAGVLIVSEQNGVLQGRLTTAGQAYVTTYESPTKAETLAAKKAIAAAALAEAQTLAGLAEKAAKRVKAEAVATRKALEAELQTAQTGEVEAEAEASRQAAAADDIEEAAAEIKKLSGEPPAS